MKEIKKAKETQNNCWNFHLKLHLQAKKVSLEKLKVIPAFDPTLTNNFHSRTAVP